MYHDTATFSSCNSVTGPFPGFPVPLEGDDVSELIERHRDELPFSDQLPTFDPPKHTDHRCAADAADHAEAPQARTRSSCGDWPIARSTSSSIAVECEFIRDYAGPFAHARHRRSARGAGGRSREFRTRSGGRTAGRQHRRRRAGAQPARVPLRAVHASTSRSAGASRATTSSPVSRRRPSPTAPPPRSSMSSGSPPTSSPPARRRPFVCWRRRCSCSASDPELQQLLRSDRSPHPELRRGDAALREPGQGRLPTLAGRHDGRRRRDAGGHHVDGAERGRQPGSPQVRRSRPVPRSSAQRPPPHRLRPRCPHCARVHHSPARRGGSASSGCSTASPTSASRSGARPARRAPLRVRADLHPPRPQPSAPRVRRDVTL